MLPGLCSIHLCRLGRCSTPGEFGTRRDGGYDLALGHYLNPKSVCTPECQLYELVGKPSEALEAGEVFAARFPFNYAANVWDRGSKARCQHALGQVDAARATWLSVIEDAHQRRLRVFEMMFNRDLITMVLDGEGECEGDGGRGPQLLPLGRAIAGMTGDRTALSELMGGGLDASKAEQMFLRASGS